MKAMNSNQGWISWFVQNPVAANLLMFCILFMGFTSLSNMRTEGFPATELRTVIIEIEYPGGSPEEIERGAVTKIESALKGLAGVEKMTATVQSGTATISIEALQDYSTSRLYSDVKVRTDAINTFPAQLEKITIKIQQQELPILDLQVHGDLPIETLTTSAERIRDQLLSLPEVSKIDFEGKREPEINILIDQQKLEAFHLTIEDIAQAIQLESLELSAGEVKTKTGTLAIVNNSKGLVGKDFGDIVIRQSDKGSTILLRDVAEVHDGYSEQSVLSSFNGYPSINLKMLLIGQDSIIPIAQAIEDKLHEIRQQNWLPENLKLQVWSNQADNVGRSLGLISSNALVGMLLVLVILSIFLHHKIAAWVAIGIPISFAGAFIVMGPQYLDYSINTITTLAFIIVLGVVVDDAIVIGENIYSHKQKQSDTSKAGLLHSTIQGAKEVATPATFGVLTTVAAFYPLTTVTGDFGGPFNIIGGVTIACLLFSLVESKFILPAHLATIQIKEPTDNHRLLSFWLRFRELVDEKLSHFIQNRYRPLISMAIEHRYQSLIVFISVFIFAIGLTTSGTVKVVFFGDNPRNMIHSEVSMNPGYTAEETQQAALHIEQSLKKAAEDFGKQYQLTDNQLVHGFVLSTTDSSAIVSAQIRSSGERSYTTKQFLNHWQQVTGDIRGARELSFYNSREESEDLRLELSSTDAKQLDAAWKQLKQQLENIDGLFDVRSNNDNQRIEYQVALTEKAYFLGLRSEQVINQLRNAIYGLEAQKIQRGEDDVSVKVRFPQSQRNSLTDIYNTRIQVSEGAYLYLHEVVHLTPVSKATTIERIDGSRTVALTGQIDIEKITSPVLIDQLQERVFPNIIKQYGQVSIALAGESKAEQDAASKLMGGFILSLLLIYGLLAIPLKSYGKPVIIMLAIPFGIVGAIFGHLIIGIPISLLSFFGILALSGVVVNDSLVLVSRYNQMTEKGMTQNTALIEAGVSRFRAILLTSLTTFAGLFPLVIETSEEAQILIPMAVSLAFGIVFATVITLFIIPVLISIAGDFHGRFVSSEETKKTALVES